MSSAASWTMGAVSGRPDAVPCTHVCGTGQQVAGRCSHGSRALAGLSAWQPRWKQQVDARVAEPRWRQLTSRTWYTAL